VSTGDASREVVPGSPRSGGAVFVGDLVTSARMLRKAPLMLVIALLLSIPFSALGVAGVLVALPVVILQAGFVGTERMWFARLIEGDTLDRAEIWPTTRQCMSRFIMLGLLVGTASVPVTAVLGAVFVHIAHSTGAFVAAAICFGVIVDVVLTFVVPALALTTASVGKAWELGTAMLRTTWPASVWYALTPGLTLVVIPQALRGGRSDHAILVVSSLVAAALALWFKGAIVAFYLRHEPPLPRAGRR
jgi:hypothetical protein